MNPLARTVPSGIQNLDNQEKLVFNMHSILIPFEVLTVPHASMLHKDIIPALHEDNMPDTNKQHG